MTLKADQTAKERRKEERRKCSMKVGCATQDLSFIDFISDINCWGVFIQSEHRVPVGESVILNIPLMGDEQSIKVIGEVMWTSPQGMGVRFNMGIATTLLDGILKS
jgi:Tfp pilus assembly protein PilZ